MLSRVFVVKFLFFVGFVITPEVFCGEQENSTKSVKIPQSELCGQFVTLRQISLEHLCGYRDIFSMPVRDALHLKSDDDVIKLVLSSAYDHVCGNRLVYCIFENKNNTLIGGIEIRKSCWCGNLGNWINDKYWGGPYHQEALGLVAQQHFMLHKDAQFFTAHVRQNNWRSYHSLKKFGFEDFNDDSKNVYRPDDHSLRFTRKKFQERHWQFTQTNFGLDEKGNNKLRWVWL